MGDKKGKDVNSKDNVIDLANKIWQAGLGAFRTAEDEGFKLFSSLMEKGEEFQKLSKKESQKQIEKFNSIIKGGVGSVKGKLGDITDHRETVWDVLKLEDVVTSVMKTVGVATNKDIDVLKKKIDALSKSVNDLKATTHKAQVKK
jgi:poly(hydroxyalkanoate) granule-associated protein